ADAAHQSVKFILTHQEAGCLARGMAAKRLRAALGDFGEELIALMGRREQEAWVPLRILFQPGERIRSKTLHRQPRQQFAELPLEVANPTVGENDVGVEDLAGERMDAAGADRRADIVVEPA